MTKSERKVYIESLKKSIDILAEELNRDEQKQEENYNLGYQHGWDDCEDDIKDMESKYGRQN